MPRFRCVIVPEWAKQNDPQVAVKDERTVEIAYEFDAPDLRTLRQWLAEASIPQGSVTSIDEIGVEELAATA